MKEGIVEASLKITCRCGNVLPVRSNWIFTESENEFLARCDKCEEVWILRFVANSRTLGNIIGKALLSAIKSSAKSSGKTNPDTDSTKLH
jgi:hypothetical protein